MRRRLDPDSLQVLKTVADLNGVTRAAEQLGLSQSGVSHRIRRLEDSIDRQLLRRAPGEPLLTEDGEKLLFYARRILDLHDEALAAMGAQPLSGQIRLGLTEDTTSRGLARIIGRFARRFPDVAIRAHVAQSLQLSREVKESRVDLAVMQVFQSDIELEDAVLGTDDVLWVRARDLAPKTVRPLPFVAFDQACFFRHWALESAAGATRDLETVLECASIDGVCSAVEAGLGYALINRRYLRPTMEVTRPDGWETPPPVAYVARPRRGLRAERKAVGALIEAVQDEFAETCEIQSVA